MAAFTVYRVAAVPFIEPSVAAPNRAANHFSATQETGDPILSRTSSARLLAVGRSAQARERSLGTADAKLRKQPERSGWLGADEALYDRRVSGRRRFSDPDKPLGRVITLDVQVLAQFDHSLEFKEAALPRPLRICWEQISSGQ